MMEILEKIGNNPLLVSLITLIVTTIFGSIGYLLKKVINDKGKKESSINTSQQGNIIQNFNTGVTYNEVRQIAEEVFEDKMREKEKKGKGDVPWNPCKSG